MIHLKDIKPDPIFDGGAPSRTSDIWATDCKFEKGKYYLITAPSGKGKSTLLHLIYGLRDDYSGQLKIDEAPIKDFKADDWAELRQTKISIVFQNLRLFPNLTALENIQLKNELSHHKSESQILEMAKQLGVESLLSKPCNTLSYGQRQRVAIIRALCQPFEYLMLDEPFSHLDEENIQIAASLIKKELSAQKAGLLLVSLGEPYPFEYNKNLIL